MSAPQFTPGPWQTNCSHIYAPDGAIIAVVHNPGSKAADYPLVPNRDLMAAAPELYALVEESLFHLRLDARAEAYHHRALAALAKVRGEQCG